MDNLIHPFNNQIHLRAFPLVTFWWNEPPWGRICGNARDAKALLDMRQMAQTYFLKRESFPRLYAPVHKMMLPILIVTTTVVLHISEIEQCVEVCQTIECQLALVPELGIRHDEVTAFKIIQHLCQAATTITRWKLNLLSRESLPACGQESHNIDILVCLVEKGIV